MAPALASEANMPVLARLTEPPRMLARLIWPLHALASEANMPLHALASEANGGHALASEANGAPAHASEANMAPACLLARLICPC